MAAVVGKILQAQAPMILERMAPRVEAQIEKTVGQFGSQTAVSNIPTMIEQSEPQVESSIRTHMRLMTPEKRTIFLQNWKMLDTAVKQESGMATGGRRKTRRRKNRK
jgi:hypothetical protein